MNTKWQHKKPQMYPDHEIEVVIEAFKSRCATCKEEVIKVPSNEGPEGLKAFFKL